MFQKVLARLRSKKHITRCAILRLYCMFFVSYGKKAALAHHPDKVSPEERKAAEARFKAASQAYEILQDDEKREMYDTHGMSAFDGSRGPGGMGGGPDLDDLFSTMFGMGGMGGMPGMGGAGRGPRQPRKSPSEQQKYEVTLEDLYKGKNVKFQSSKQILCPSCKGSGGKEKAKAMKCSTCKGQGIRQVLRQVGPGMLTQETVECSACAGQGSLFNTKDKCKKCKGNRTVESKSQLEIYIPRGAKEGETIVLEGEADHVPGAQEPGDLIFHLKELPHSVFQRGGPDLTAKVEITLAEALTGFHRVLLKHLDGRGIELLHPQQEGQILRPGQVLRINGEGMPHKRSDAKGDLYLTVDIQFPPDGFLKDPTAPENLRILLPQPPPPIKVDEVDEVDYEPHASMEDFGGRDAAGGWEDEEDEADGPQAQCAQQ
jgi:DnaJ homolog subfamily A member 2